MVQSYSQWGNRGLISLRAKYGRPHHCAALGTRRCQSRCARGSLAYLSVPFPMCYGSEFSAKAVKPWLACIGGKTLYI